LLELADTHHVNLAGMVSWSFEFEGRDYFEGFRSLATNGIDKPVLNVFRMMGMMGGERVATTSSGAVPMATMLDTGVRGKTDVDALATKEKSGADVMVWDYHDVADGGEAAEVRVEVDGLPVGVGRALLQEYRIDETHSNAYTVWKGMGSPQSLTVEQISELRAAGGLELLRSPEWVELMRLSW